MRDKIKKSKWEVVSGKWLKFGEPSLLVANCLLLTAYCLLLTTNCLYASGTGTTAGVIMLDTVGSRNFALGGAFTSVSGDAYSMFANPAGLADISKKQLSSYFVQGQNDDYRAALVYDQWLLTDMKSGLGLGIYNLNGGKMDINFADGTSQNVISQSDYLVTLSWGGYTARNFMLGYTVKYLSTELVEKYKATALAFDTGFIAKLGDVFSWGAAMQNYGTKISYNGAKEPLPFLLRSGLSANLHSGRYQSFLIAADGIYLINERETILSGGLEYSIAKSLFLRGGYKVNGDVSSITGGVGINIADSVGLDWTAEMNDLATTNNVSLTIKF